MKPKEWDPAVLPSKGGLVIGVMFGLLLMTVINSKILDFQTKLVMGGLVLGISYFFCVGEFCLNSREARK